MNQETIFSLEILSILTIIIMVSLIICIVMLIIHIIKLKKYENKYNEIWSKFDNDNLEKDIENLLNNMEETKRYCEETKIECSSIEGKMQKCVQKVGLVKYDAYETGNNGLSFALALLNYKDDGVLINSVYTREGSNIYAREIVNGEAKNNLSIEENEALKKALNSKSFM